jgi:uncharacterized membrane protein
MSLWLLLLWIAFIVAAGFLVDVFCQRKVITLPEEEQGEFELPWEEDGMTDVTAEISQEGTSYLVTEKGGITRFHLNDRYVDKLQITYDSDQMVAATWYVWEEGADTPICIEDLNSVLIQSTTVKLDMVVNRIEIQWSIEKIEEEESPEDQVETTEDDTTGEASTEEASAEDSLGNMAQIRLKTAVILNRYVRNWFRILFVWAILGLATFLGLGRKWIGTHMAAAYLVTALTTGTVMILMLPSNKVSWDEEMHFFHAYCVSHFGTEVQTNDILEQLFVASEENWPYSLPANLEERQEMNASLNARMATEEYVYSRGHALAGIYTLAYIPQAIGLRIGFLLHLPFTVTYQLGRWCGLLAFALIFAWAIDKIPKGKAILAMLGLLPTPLFLMSAYSYDPFITALFALGFACFMDEYVNWQRKMTWPGFLQMAGCFAIGATAKALYIPMILVIFLLPHEKFRDRRQEYLMKGLVLAGFIIGMASFVLPEVISPDEVGDVRGGDTSDVGQIGYILGDIPGFLELILSSILVTLPGYLFGTEVFGSMAYLRIGMMEIAIPLLVFFVLLCEDKHIPCKKGKLDWQARTWILVLCGAIIGMVWLAMYLAFTPVGSKVINGVQARYYLPLLLPIYLCICPETLQIQMKKEWLYLFTLAGSSAITLTTIGIAVLSLCG